MPLWELVPLLESPWEEKNSENQNLPFLIRSLWDLGSCVTLLQVLLFVNSKKPIVDTV